MTKAARVRVPATRLLPVRIETGRRAFPAVKELPHKISALVYAFDEAGQMLMIHRRQAPNQGLWSPFGGKLKTALGESPHQCAARETLEETGFRFNPEDFHLAGVVSEQGYEGETHWLMFLFELKPRLTTLPPPHEEGTFEFVPTDEVPRRKIPLSDRDVLWPLFQKHRGGFFAVSIQCQGPDGAAQSWRVEQALPAAPSL